MIFLIRPTDRQIAAVEDADRAPAYEARGFSRVPYADYRAAWLARDLAVLKTIYKDAPIETVQPDSEPLMLPPCVPSAALDVKERERQIYGFHF